MKRKILVEVSASLLVLLFLYAALTHWLNFSRFTYNINNQPLPAWLKPALIWGIPMVELLIVAGLLFEKTRLRAMQVSFLLLLSLTTYIVLILAHFFDRIPCSCSGLVPNLSWEQHLWFNVLFLVIALIGILLKSGRLGNQTTTATRTMLH